MKKYKNPPIDIVSCDIVFKRNEANSWNTVFVGKIFDKLQSIYPKSEDVKKITANFDVNKNSFDVGDSKANRLYNDDKCSVFIEPKGVEYVNGNYKGWGVVEDDIAKVFATYIEETKPESIENISLRYVNKIYVPVVNNILNENEYFNIYPEYSAVEQKCVRYDTRLLFSYGNGESLNLVMLAFPSPEKDEILFIVDLCYNISKFDSLVTGDIKSSIDKAHAKIEDVFEKIITDKTRELFN